MAAKGLWVTSAGAEPSETRKAPTMKEKWRIRVNGYGTFDFEGTEAEAEEMRRHKSHWEGGFGYKWRVENQTRVDALTAEMCALFDAGKGVSAQLLKTLHKAKTDAALSEHA